MVSSQVGLCHKSELSDDLITNIETKYKVGDKVTAKILKVNIFLGQKCLLIISISCAISAFCFIVLLFKIIQLMINLLLALDF